MLVMGMGHEPNPSPTAAAQCPNGDKASHEEPWRGGRGNARSWEGTLVKGSLE